MTDCPQTSHTEWGHSYLGLGWIILFADTSGHSLVVVLKHRVLLFLLTCRAVSCTNYVNLCYAKALWLCSYANSLTENTIVLICRIVLCVVVNCFVVCCL